MLEGWVKVYRKIKESRSVSRGIEYLGAMVWLVLNANHTDGWHNGMECKRGQVFVGREMLAKRWKITERAVRTILSNLEKDEFMTSRTTNKGTVITICKYDSYQSIEEKNDQQNDQQPTSNQPADVQRPTSNKNERMGEGIIEANASSPKRSAAGPKITFEYDGDRRIRGITQSQLDLWKENFPALDVEIELKSASAWLDGHDKNRKKDIKRFLTGWFLRAQERAKAIPNGPKERDELGI